MPYIGTQPTKVVSRQSANVYRYEATAGQTAFTGADLDNNVLACNPADMIVHMNGLRLESTDYTATSTTVTLTTAATAGDEVTVTSFETFEVADTYTKTAADDRYVNASGDTMTGNLSITSGVNTETRTLLIDNAHSGGSMYNALGVYVGGTDRLVRLSADYGESLMAFNTNGTERMKIDSAGRVTMPYQPAFDVALDGSNYTTANPVIFDEVYHNVGSHYSTATGRFTCPVAGMYLFYTSHIKNGSTAVSRRRFNKNGSATKGGRHQRLTETSINTYGDNGTFFIIIECAAGDYITVEQYAGSVYGSREYDYFGGYLIG
jgi:hypothetical protein